MSKYSYMPHKQPSLKGTEAMQLYLLFYLFLLNIPNIQYTCNEAAQQLHHTSHPTDSHSEKHTEASRVNALLKGTLTYLPPGQET